MIALGDNFHDLGGPERLAPSDRTTLFDLQRGRDWIWIAATTIPIRAAASAVPLRARVSLGSLIFRHEPKLVPNEGEIAGHLHPCARVHRRGRVMTRRCFASDGQRMILPAFGAYTGGLNIRDPAFIKVFGALAFTAHVIGELRLYSFAAARCRAD